MKIIVCIGSSCHLKGSRLVVEGLQKLAEASGFGSELELSGAFCMGKCMEGVCVKIDEEMFSVQPDHVGRFFEKEVLGRLKKLHASGAIKG